MYSGRWGWPGLCLPHLSPLLTYRQNLLSSLKTTECHSTLQSTLSRHHAWQCCDVSGSLARDTCDLSPAASRRFPMVLSDTAGETRARMSSLDAVQAATAASTMCQLWCVPVLCGRQKPGLWVWECSIDHCWKQRHTTDTLYLICAAILWYVHPDSHRHKMQPHSNDQSC